MPEPANSIFAFIVDWLHDGEPARGCLSTKTLFGESIEEPIRGAVASLLDRLEAAMRERLSVPDRTARLALSPAKAARLAIAVTRGVVVLERVYPDNRKRLLAVADSFLEILFE